MGKRVHHYQYILRKKDTQNAVLVEQIRSLIKNLKVSVNSFLIVTIPHYKRGNKSVVFFQTIRERTFRKTNFYDYEIRIDVKTETGTVKTQYSRSQQTQAETLQAFEDICIKRIFPDVSTWENITEIVYHGPKKDNKYFLADTLLSHYRELDVPAPVQNFCRFEAMRYLNGAPRDYPSDYLRLADFYCAQSMYAKAMELYKQNTSIEGVSFKIAQLIIGGNCGKHNYKSAYDYFKHATIFADGLFSDYAKIEIARMYRDGKYLKQNYKKYEQILRSVEKKFNIPNKTFNSCHGALYYELALSELKKGNRDAALAYCTEARRTVFAYLIVSDDFDKRLALRETQNILRLFYTLTDFDQYSANLFDLMFIMEKTIKISFCFDGDIYQIETFYKDGRLLVKFGDSYFNGVVNFFLQAMLKGNPLKQYGLRCIITEIKQ